MSHEEWLKSLKPGDKVAYNGSVFGVNYHITEVLKITPTGIIRLGNSHSADNRGYVKGNHPWGGGYHIEPITDEILDQIKKKKLGRRVGNFDFHNLATDQLERIAQILDEKVGDD